MHFHNDTQISSKIHEKSVNWRWLRNCVREMKVSWAKLWVLIRWLIVTWVTAFSSKLLNYLNSSHDCFGVSRESASDSCRQHQEHNSNRWVEKRLKDFWSKLRNIFISFWHDARLSHRVDTSATRKTWRRGEIRWFLPQHRSDFLD